MDKDEYEKAWAEGEDDKSNTLENAVEAAGKKAKANSDDEYLAAHAELDKEDDKKSEK